MEEELNYHIPEDAVVIVLTADGDDLNIKMTNSLSEDMDEDEYNWLLTLQQGIASALQVSMPHLMELGEAAMISHEEGIAEVFLELFEQNQKEKKRKKDVNKNNVINLFDKKEEKKDGED